MESVGIASAKLLLFGEHAAVHGYTALGTSLPETLVARVSGGASAWRFDGVPPEDRDAVAGVVRAIEESWTGAERPRPGAVTVESRIPRGTGFGSSAALCGALARALLSRAPGAVGADDAWRVAHEAERLFHGTPSGIDTGLALSPGLSVFRPRPGSLPERLGLPRRGLWLVIGAVPRDARCGELVAGVGRRMTGGDLPTAAALGALGDIASRAARLLDPDRDGDGNGDRAECLGALATEAMTHLRALGLGNPTQDALLEAGARCGALGGKASGAGGGGAFYLVARDRREAERVARGVEEAARDGKTSVPGGVRIVEI